MRSGASVIAALLGRHERAGASIIAGAELESLRGGTWDGQTYDRGGRARAQTGGPRGELWLRQHQEQLGAFADRVSLRGLSEEEVASYIRVAGVAAAGVQRAV